MGGYVVYGRNRETSGVKDRSSTPVPANTVTSIYYTIDNKQDHDSLVNRAKNIECFSDSEAFPRSYKTAISYKQIQENGAIMYVFTIEVGKFSVAIKTGISGRSKDISLSDKRFIRAETTTVSLTSAYPRFNAYVYIGQVGKNEKYTTFVFTIEAEFASVRSTVNTYARLFSGDELSAITQATRSLQARMDGPKLFGLAAAEAIYGANITLVILRENNRGFVREYLRRPLLTRFVRGVGCTLSQKILYLNTKNGKENVDLTDGIVGYGMLRYFLWFLITRIWNARILKRSYTKRFLNAVYSSEYVSWLPYLENSEYGRYFIK